MTVRRIIMDDDMYLWRERHPQASGSSTQHLGCTTRDPKERYQYTHRLRRWAKENVLGFHRE